MKNLHSILNKQGVDYLKYDNCNNGNKDVKDRYGVPPFLSRPHEQWDELNMMEAV